MFVLSLVRRMIWVIQFLSDYRSLNFRKGLVKSGLVGITCLIVWNLQIVPVKKEVSSRKSTVKKVGKRGFREIKNLMSFINYDGRAASREATVSRGC